MLYYTGSVWQLAEANTLATSEAVGLVSTVIDANNFDLLTSGYASLPALTLVAGDIYYLSDTVAGAMQNTDVTTPGHISKMVFIATSVTAGYFINTRGYPVTSAAFTWNTQTTSATLVANNGYISTSTGSPVAFTLPATANVGDTFKIAGEGSAGWTLAQNSSQQMFFGTNTTTAGVSGSLTSSEVGDCIEFICVVANVSFLVLSSMGTITGA